MKKKHQKVKKNQKSIEKTCKKMPKILFVFSQGIDKKL